MAQLQNVPSRSKPQEYDERIQKLGPRIRVMFSASPPDEASPEGYDLIVIDESQLELRLGAQFTKDPTLQDVYKRHVEVNDMLFYIGDIHAETATRMDVPRKLAKCLDGSTIVRTDDNLCSIESILSGLEPDEHRKIPTIRLADGTGNHVNSSWGVVRHDIPSKIVVTRRGIVCCTSDHRWETMNDGLVEAQNLKNGTEMPMSWFPPVNETHPRTVRINPFTRRVDPKGAVLTLGEEWAYFAGMFHGDGSMTTGHSCCITHGKHKNYREWRKTVMDASHAVGLDPTLAKDKRSTYLGSRTVVRLLADLRLEKGRTKEPRVPWWVIEGGRRVICAYLAGLIDTDGSVDDHVNITQKSPIFIGQIAVLFRALGCPVTIEPNWNKTYKRWYYRLRVLAPGIRIVNDEVPLRETSKRRKLELRAAKKSNKPRVLKDEVLQVLDAGKRTVYDFHVDSDDHLYFQGGLIGHNNLNFGLMYGMSAASFARYAKLYLPGTKQYDVHSAEKYVRSFRNTYAGVFNYHEKLRNRWYEGKRSFLMISGRYRHFPKWARVSPGTVYNSKIQGSAADVLKVQLWAIDKWILSNPEFQGLRPLIQVHDEFIFEVPKRISQKSAVALKYFMEYPFFITDVPLLASAKVCQNWSAKDDDNIPEIGTFYARIDGKDRLFRPNQWKNFLAVEKKASQKSCVAMLTPKQTAWARSLMPEKTPVFGKRIQGVSIMSIEEYRKRKEQDQ